MSPMLWGIAALITALAAAAAATWIFTRRAPGPALDEDLPATPLQRLARRSLGLGLALGAAAAALVVALGPERLFAETPFRLGFTALVLAVLGVLAFLSVRAWTWARREDGTLDERDRGILGSAHSVQAAAMLVTLAAWMIGLQETYREAGAIPVAWLMLVFWSCVVANVLALPLGILLGYRRG